MTTPSKNLRKLLKTSRSGQTRLAEALTLTKGGPGSGPHGGGDGSAKDAREATGKANNASDKANRTGAQVDHQAAANAHYAAADANRAAGNTAAASNHEESADKHDAAASGLGGSVSGVKVGKLLEDLLAKTEDGTTVLSQLLKGGPGSGPHKGGVFGVGHSENDPAYKKTNAAVEASKKASSSSDPKTHVAAAKAHAAAAEAHYQRAADAIDSGDKPKAFQSAGAALEHADQAKFHADEIQKIAQDTGSVVPPSLKGQATLASTQADMSYDKIYNQLGVSG